MCLPTSIAVSLAVIIGRNNKAMGNVEHRSCQYRFVRVYTIIKAPVWKSDRRRSVIYRVRTTKRIVRHEVETELKRFLNLGTYRITISLVRILHVNNTAITAWLASVENSRRVFSTIHRIYALAFVYKGKVFKPNIVEVSRVKSFQGKLHVPRQSLFPSQVGTEHLWELEIASHRCNIRFHRNGIKPRGMCCPFCIILKCFEWRSKSTRFWVCTNRHAFLLYTRVGPSVFNPNEGCTSIKHT